MLYNFLKRGILFHFLERSSLIDLTLDVVMGWEKEIVLGYVIQEFYEMLKKKEKKKIKTSCTIY